MRAAEVANAQGRLADVETICHSILDADRSHIEARLMLGLVKARRGQGEEALRLLHEVLEVKPDSFEARFWISTVHRKAGHVAQALEFAESAAALRPDDPFACNNLGMCLLDASNAHRAAEQFSKAARAKPDSGPILHNLGSALLQVRRDREAAQALERASALQPNSVETALALARARFRLHEYDQAEATARIALQSNPRNLEARLLVANVASALGRFEDAERELQETAELFEDSPEALNALAVFLQEMGRFEEAREVLGRSLLTRKAQGSPFYFLVQSKKVDEDDLFLIRQMESIVSERILPANERRMLFYGLAKAYEDLGRNSEAWESFQEAHRLTYAALGRPQFDRAAYAKSYENTRSLFNSELMASHPNAGLANDLPILITGMIRSGTTLMEQILSNHRSVGPAGEQFFWLDRAGDALNGSTLDTKKLRALAADYVALLQRIAPDKPRVTDKMPGNHAHLGLIHLALPNARLIHMRRNPIDTCLSIYTTRINRPPEFAGSLSDIAFAYRQYERAMSHWRTVLPPNRFLEIDYEDLTQNGEAVIRRVLEFCGLDWDPACMEFGENVRNVRTPSMWRVRQALDKSSVERWRKYEPWISGLIEGINPLNRCCDSLDLLSQRGLRTNRGGSTLIVTLHWDGHAETRRSQRIDSIIEHR